MVPGQTDDESSGPTLYPTRQRYEGKADRPSAPLRTLYVKKLRLVLCWRQQFHQHSVELAGQAGREDAGSLPMGLAFLLLSSHQSLGGCINTRAGV